jgi:hypothetical protein
MEVTGTYPLCYQSTGNGKVTRYQSNSNGPVTGYRVTGERKICGPWVFTKGRLFLKANNTV